MDGGGGGLLMTARRGDGGRATPVGVEVVTNGGLWEHKNAVRMSDFESGSSLRGVM